MIGSTLRLCVCSLVTVGIFVKKTKMSMKENNLSLAVVVVYKVLFSLVSFVSTDKQTKCRFGNCAFPFTNKTQRHHSQQTRSSGTRAVRRRMYYYRSVRDSNALNIKRVDKTNSIVLLLLRRSGNGIVAVDILSSNQNDV